MRIVEIVEHKHEWRDQYSNIAAKLRKSGSKNLVRIDHVGSTAVLGLAAKDVIDIQVTVHDLDNPEHVRSFQNAGFRGGSEIGLDFLIGAAPSSADLRKRFFREPEGERRTHIHVREEGRINQRYALLFRDYLRSDPNVQQSYEAIKRRLAETYPNDIDGYLSIKDPVMDLIYRSAEYWATAVGWRASEDYD